jgi:hypothetical protein
MKKRTAGELLVAPAVSATTDDQSDEDCGTELAVFDLVISVALKESD